MSAPFAPCHYPELPTCPDCGMATHHQLIYLCGWCDEVFWEKFVKGGLAELLFGWMRKIR